MGIEYEWCREFDFRSAEYQSLFEISGASAFQHPLWLDRIYRELVPIRNVRPAVLTGRRANGELAYVLPMIKRSFGPLSIGEYADLGVSDYCQPIMDETMVRALSSDRALREELGATLQHFSIGRLQKFDVGSLRQSAGCRSASVRQMAVHAHPVNLKAPFSTWRNTALTDSFRRFLDRKRRRLNRKADITFGVVSGDRAIEDAFRSLQEFHLQRWPSSLLHRPSYFNFYLNVAREGGVNGFARTYEMRANGKSAGVLFGLASRGKFLLLMMGLDYGTYRNYSVGLLMVESAIEDAIARDESVFDLTIGDEPYKAEFGTSSEPLYNMWFGSLAATQLASLAYRARVKFQCARERFVLP